MFKYLTTSARTYQWCSVDSDDCYGGITTNELGEGGFLNGATSEAYTSCNNLNTSPLGGFAGKTNWRVPTRYELATLFDDSRTTRPILM
ncbi:MAG: hypothetical protein AAF518_19030 [Spirochaetota bacterium]